MESLVILEKQPWKGFWGQMLKTEIKGKYFNLFLFMYLYASLQIHYTHITYITHTHPFKYITHTNFVGGKVQGEQGLSC